jgi:hypothetical protein
MLRTLLSMRVDACESAAAPGSDILNAGGES